jgi:hypothetical protein
MESLLSVIELITKTYGLVGLLMLSPIMACIFLFRENQKLHKEQLDAMTTLANAIQTSNELALEAQKMRVTDAQSVAQKLLDAMMKQTETNKETNIVLNLLNQELSHRK